MDGQEVVGRLKALRLIRIAISVALKNLHLNKHTVPTPGLLLTAIGHCSGSRRARTAQDQLEAGN